MIYKALKSQKESGRIKIVWHLFSVHPLNVFVGCLVLMKFDVWFLTATWWWIHVTRSKVKVMVTRSLPYLRGGQALTPAQRWSHISSAQCASPNVTTRLQVVAIKP